MIYPVMIQEKVTVMHNNTICIPKKVRQKLGIKLKDKLIVVVHGDSFQVKRYQPVGWKDVVGIAKDTFDSYGGGAAYLKKERESWND
jgi:AbrB family looped-hinge helix DNA binding protein